MATIPVVDFSCCSMDIEEVDDNLPAYKSLAEEICNALKSVGFLYLMNHGIPEEKVRRPY